MVTVLVAGAVEVKSGSHRRWEWKNLIGQMCQLNLLNRQLNQVNPIEFIEIDQEEEYPEVVRGSLVIKLSFLNDSH